MSRRRSIDRMSELPPPDIRDASGRMRRLVLAFVVGVVAAAITYMICMQIAEPDTLPNLGGKSARAYRFVYYMTGLVGAGGFSLTLVIQNWIAKKAWQRERGVASAKLVK